MHFRQTGRSIVFLLCERQHWFKGQAARRAPSDLLLNQRSLACMDCVNRIELHESKY
jgi:hypothetical protein